eukprot:scaffold8215_cov41-Prasinocladus_malaysianus.AAC.1
MPDRPRWPISTPFRTLPLASLGAQMASTMLRPSADAGLESPEEVVALVRQLNHQKAAALTEAEELRQQIHELRASSEVEDVRLTGKLAETKQAAVAEEQWSNGQSATLQQAYNFLTEMVKIKALHVFCRCISLFLSEFPIALLCGIVYASVPIADTHDSICSVPSQIQEQAELTLASLGLSDFGSLLDVEGEPQDDDVDETYPSHCSAALPMVRKVFNRAQQLQRRCDELERQLAQAREADEPGQDLPAELLNPRQELQAAQKGSRSLQSHRQAIQDIVTSVAGGSSGSIKLSSEGDGTMLATDAAAMASQSNQQEAATIAQNEAKAVTDLENAELVCKLAEAEQAAKAERQMSCARLLALQQIHEQARSSIAALGLSDVGSTNAEEEEEEGLNGTYPSLEAAQGNGALPMVRRVFNRAQQLQRRCDELERQLAQARQEAAGNGADHEAELAQARQELAAVRPDLKLLQAHQQAVQDIVQAVQSPTVHLETTQAQDSLHQQPQDSTTSPEEAVAVVLRVVDNQRQLEAQVSDLQAFRGLSRAVQAAIGRDLPGGLLAESECNALIEMVTEEIEEGRRMKESAAEAARLAEAVTSRLEGGVAAADARFVGEALRTQQYQQALEQ